MSMDKKLALITGGSRGIGAAIVERLAQDYTIVATATSQKGADGITEELKSIGNAGCGMVLNLDSDSSIFDTMKAIETDFAAPSVLVNNAGVTQDDLFLRMSLEKFDSVLQTNLYGIFKLTKACVKSMIKARWGRIINMTSVVAFSGNAGQVNYSTAKAGLVGFSKSLAREIASRKVTVNLVAPGFIETDMTSGLDEKVKTKLLSEIPLARMGMAKEVAAAVGFLAQEDSSYITGETIHVNGGMLMN